MTHIVNMFARKAGLMTIEPQIECTGEQSWMPTSSLSLASLTIYNPRELSPASVQVGIGSEIATLLGQLPFVPASTKKLVTGIRTKIRRCD